MSSSKRIFSGVMWSIIYNVVNALYGFSLVPILISYFGKAEYGLISLATSLNAYMRLLDMGLTSTNVRFFSNWLSKGDTEKARKLFSTCTAFYTVVGLINAIVLCVVYFFSDSIFNVTPAQDVILKQLLLILVVSAFVNWFTSCYNQIIQATENVDWAQKQMLATKLLMVVVLLSTIYFELTVVQYYILTVLSVWVVLPWVVRKIRHIAPFISFMPRFDKQVFKEILPYTLGVFSFMIFSFSYDQLKPVLLGIQGTVESVTNYKVMMGIVGLCTSVCSVFITTLLPSSSKVMANNDTEAYYKIAYQGTKYIMAFMVFCVFGMMCIDKDLLVLYVGEEYLYLVKWLNVLICILLTNHILAISSLILGGTNIKPLARMTAVSAVLAIATGWFAIPHLQVGGVALSAIVYNVCQMLFYYLYFWPKVMKINSWKIFSTIVLPLTLIGVAIYMIESYIPHLDSHVLNVVIFGCLFVVLYIPMLFIYFNKTDRQFIYNLIKKRR